MEKIKNILNEILRNKELPEISQISKSDHLVNDFGLDSLDLAELTVRIEVEFDIDIFEDGIVTTIGEIVDKVQKNNE